MDAAESLRSPSSSLEAPKGDGESPEGDGGGCAIELDGAQVGSIESFFKFYCVMYTWFCLPFFALFSILCSINIFFGGFIASRRETSAGNEGAEERRGRERDVCVW